MGFRRLRQLIGSDLYRHAGTTGCRDFFRYLLGSPGFNYTFWLRLAAWSRAQPSAVRVLAPIFALVKRHYSIKYGIAIPRTTQIGPGFYIGHFGGIVVHGDCKIGRDCNISQGVTLGISNRGPRKGVPVVGDRVYIGPGAKIIGRVHIGSNVAIGANAVVTHDVPDNAVVVGVPAWIVSFEGAAHYIEQTDYKESLLSAGDLPGDGRPGG